MVSILYIFLLKYIMGGCLSLWLLEGGCECCLYLLGFARVCELIGSTLTLSEFTESNKQSFFVAANGVDPYKFYLPFGFQ